MSCKNFIELKRKALENYFDRMNPEQKKAVFTIKGPVLILAGAGSGKTTVLVNRIANMVRFGNAYDSKYVNENISDEDIAFLENFKKGDDGERLRDIICNPDEMIKPWNILAITFTNKAAGELKQRLADMLGDDGNGIVAATFHSACVRILRREIEQLGYPSDFTIYDSDDSQRVIKTCLSELDISDKMFPPKNVAGVISSAKDRMLSPEDFEEEYGNDFRMATISKIYALYQKKLFSSGALDFDDIIRLTVILFEKFPETLRHYRNLYKYIMVDEYQDTNHAQYRLVSLLSEEHRNLCVVGDDDQSIYKFRGATIENILGFEDEFKDCRTIRLEQNYRSTQNILSAANEVIKNNRGRKSKTLWTADEDGDKVKLCRMPNENAESRFIADEILDGIKNGGKYSDYAILYRMNAQSNSVERAFTNSGIPYRVFGGLRFYDRKEIKDMIAYLSVVNNPYDMLRLKRIINEPKRSIGEATVSALEQIFSDTGVSPVEIMANAESYQPLVKKASVLKPLGVMFKELEKSQNELALDEMLDVLIEVSGYGKYLVTLGDEGITRAENINELKTSMKQYSEQAENPTLSGFLEEISLYTDVDKYEEQTETVTLMTMHAAKGLEFPVVFVIGMEDGIFPSVRSLNSEEDIEEERRLAYVAITRAKKSLYLTYCAERMLFGQTNRNLVSRFIKEIPPALADKIDKVAQKPTATIGFSLGDTTSSGTRSMSLQSQLSKAPKKKEEICRVEFAVGDRIRHKVFGDGTVISVRKMSNDSMLEVAFDNAGSKKLMANFAKIEKI
ncbi:MAG: ATP-dependent helicase [Oscillospiraceae bacterium]